jgi:hypothetical protein
MDDIIRRKRAHAAAMIDVILGMKWGDDYCEFTARNEAQRKRERTSRSDYDAFQEERYLHRKAAAED